MIDLSYKDSLRAVHEVFLQRFGGRKIRVYEAGGGSASILDRSALNIESITVVDIDEVQLKNNSYADIKILGDIEVHAFAKNSFDLVVCYNVVEHLRSPDRAIDLFLEAAAPGGLVFIGAPNPKSFSGWITKLTPHWFHVWYYRVILKHERAGQPGQVPFPTIYHPIVEPLAMSRFCEERGFEVVYLKEYQDDKYQRIAAAHPLLGWLVNFAVGCANALTLWRRELKNGDFHIVLSKPNAKS